MSSEAHIVKARVNGALARAFPEWSADQADRAATREAISKQTSAPGSAMVQMVGDHLEFLLSTNWILRPECMGEFVAMLHQEMTDPEVVFEPGNGAFRIRCQKSDAAQMTRLAQGVMDRLIERELEKGPDEMKNVMTRSEWQKQGGFPAEEENQYAKYTFPREVAESPHRRAWEIPQDLVHEGLTLEEMMPANATSTFQRATGCTMVLSHSAATVYIGSDTAENAEAAMRKLGGIAKLFRLPAPAQRNFEIILHSEHDQQPEGELRFIAHTDKKLLTTYFLDRGEYDMATKKQSYRMLFEKGVIVSMVPFDRKDEAFAWDSAKRVEPATKEHMARKPFQEFAPRNWSYPAKETDAGPPSQASSPGRQHMNHGDPDKGFKSGNDRVASWVQGLAQPGAAEHQDGQGHSSQSTNGTGKQSQVDLATDSSREKVDRQEPTTKLQDHILVLKGQATKDINNNSSQQSQPKPGQLATASRQPGQNTSRNSQHMPKANGPKNGSMKNKQKGRPWSKNLDKKGKPSYTAQIPQLRPNAGSHTQPRLPSKAQPAATTGSQLRPGNWGDWVPPHLRHLSPPKSPTKANSGTTGQDKAPPESDLSSAVSKNTKAEERTKEVRGIIEHTKKLTDSKSATTQADPKHEPGQTICTLQPAVARSDITAIAIIPLPPTPPGNSGTATIVTAAQQQSTGSSVDHFAELYREARISSTGTTRYFRARSGTMQTPQRLIGISPERSQPALHKDDEHDTRTFHNTMRQQTASRSMLSNVRHVPEAKLLREINERLLKSMKPLRMITGHLSLKAELGRFCFTNLHVDHIQLPDQNAPERRHNLESMQGSLNKNHCTSKDVLFTKILSTLGGDAKFIASMQENDSTKMWHLDSRHTIYEVHCLAETKEGKTFGFAADIDAHTFQYTIRPWNAESSSLAVHCIDRSFDFQLTLTTAQDMEKLCGSFINHLVRMIRVLPQKNDIPIIETTIHKEYSVRVRLVRVRNVASYTRAVRAQRTAEHITNVLEIIEVHDMKDARAVNTEETATTTRWVKSPGSERDGITSSWYEATIESRMVRDSFRQNQTLEFGEEAEWSAEEFQQAGAFDELIRTATDVVKRIDGVGFWCDNFQDTMIHPLPPRSIQEVEAKKRRTKPKTDRVVFW